MNASDTKATGSCLCEAVFFEARLPSRWVAHCHCSRCRRAHGAAFVTWVGLDADGVALRDPGARLSWYRAAGGGERGFCSVCGSTLFFRSPNWPGELHAVLANFDGPVDRAPQAHAYWDTHVDWVAIADELPKKPAPDAASS
ncbi:MAG TPA: GFA family protein [Caldimonas sp.]